MAHHPTSPLSREWLSMMGSSNGDGRREQQERRQPTSTDSYYSRRSHSGQPARIKPPTHQRRSRQRPASTSELANDNSWWGSSTGVGESPSMELEASSMDDGGHLQDLLQARHRVSAARLTTTTSRVRFDQSADHAKTREMVVAKQASLFSSSPAERILDMMSDSLCSSFEDSPSMSTLEKRMASSPILRNFIVPDDDDESNILASDSESEISDPGSPKGISSRSRSRSFTDDTFVSDRPIVPPPTASNSDEEDSRNNYKNILHKIAKERNERKARQEAKRNRDRATSKPGPKQHPLQLPSVWAPTTNTVGRMQLPNEDKSLNPTQKAAVTSSPLTPLTKMTATFLETIGLSSSKSGSQSELPAAPLQKELDEIEAALKAAKNRDTDEQENLSHSQTLSTKENGLPSSVQVYDGRPPSGVWSQTSSRSTSRQQPVKSMAPATSIQLTTSVSCLTDDASPYGMGEGTKMCVPTVFQKRLTQLRKLKESKISRKSDKAESESSGSHTYNSSAMMGSGTLHAVLAGSSKSSGIKPESNTNVNRSTSGSYDEDSKHHAYIAYFERGLERARQTIRMYEHSVPPRFPTTGNEVVVKVDASTISETDSRVRHGDYWGINSSKPLALPIIPGVAFCGTITQTDKPASRYGLKIGDQVVSLVRTGANARHICADPSQVVKVPSDVKSEPDKIACLPEVYLSAFQALHIDHKHGLRYSKSSMSDKAVLILGGTTAIGRALCELAISAGSGTVYATAKQQQRYVVESTGAIPVDRDPHHWYSLLVGKMDLVIFVDKGNSELSELKYEHIQTLTRNGKLIVVGHPDDEGSKVVDLATVDEQSIGTQRKLYHYNVFNQWDEDVKQAKKDLLHLLRLLGDAKIEPKILEKLPLTKVARAHEIIEKTSLGGFVLCKPWLKDPNHKSGNGSSRSERKITASTGSGKHR